MMSRAKLLPRYDNLLFLDFESTGLMSDDATVPLEAAGIVTDGNLDVLAIMDSQLVEASAESLAAMGDFVREMHTKTGLLKRLEECGGRSLEAVEDSLLELVGNHFPTKGDEVPYSSHGYRGIVLAGNSVAGLDLPLMHKFFPRVAKLCDHRVYDVSSLGEEMRRRDPAYFAAMPPKTSDHTALHDIRESLREARYYRAYTP